MLPPFQPKLILQSEFMCGYDGAGAERGGCKGVLGTAVRWPLLAKKMSRFV